MKTRIFLCTLLGAIAVAVSAPGNTLVVAESPLASLLLQETMDADEQGVAYESALQPETAQFNALLADAEAPIAPLVLTSALTSASSNPQSSLRFLLAASFDPTTAGSGKVWAIRTHSESEGHVLIAGLSQDVGLCFDSAHDFLYVFDRKEDSFGRISQYELQRDAGSLELKKPEAVLVYEGEAVSSCAVDAFGNLYFALPHSIAFASFVDLWSGLENQFDTLYSGLQEHVVSPSDLAVTDGWLYWVTVDKDLVRAPDRFHLGKVPEVAQQQSMSVAASRTDVYQTLSDGSISALNQTSYVTDLSRPRAKCTAAGDVYVADASSGELAVFRDGHTEVLAVVLGLSDAECVEAWARSIAVCIGALLVV